MPVIHSRLAQRLVIQLVAVGVVAGFTSTAAAGPASSGRGASPPACTDLDVKDALERYLQSQDAVEGTLALAYDHRQESEWWRAYQWSGSGLAQLSLKDDRFDIRPQDRPRLTVSKKTPVRVFVVRTNPLLYTATPGESSEADRPDLAALQQLAGLVGGVASASLRVEDTEALSIAAAEEADVVAFVEGEMMTIDEGDLDDAGDLIQTIETLKDFLKESSQKLQPELADLKAEAGALESSLATFQKQRALLENHLREVELGLATSVVPADEWPTWPSFDGLESARRELEAVEPRCPPVLRKLERFLVLALEEGDVSAAERRERDELALVLPGMECGVLADPLQTPRTVIGRLLEAVVTRRYQFSPAAKAALNAGLDLLESYREVVDARETLLGSSKKLLDQQKDVPSNAPFYAALETRYRQETGSVRRIGALTCGLFELTRAQGEDVRVGWTKIRTESAKIVADPRLKKIVEPDRPTDVTIQYELARQSVWQDLDLNFGVIYTEVADPTFTAVADPEETMTAAAAAEEEEPDPVLQIRQTDEETRAGELALFATWNLWKLRESIPLGVQIGAAVDSDKPAFFAGLSLGIGPYVRLSGGYATYKVKELDGQEPGDDVASQEAIRMRDDFEEGEYFALTIAIDELPFFQPADDEE